MMVRGRLVADRAVVNVDENEVIEGDPAGGKAVYE
jgi:hypothetical protein